MEDWDSSPITDVVFLFVATCIPAMRSSEPRIVAALSGNNVMQLGRDVAHNNAQTFVRVARCFYKDATLFYVLHIQIKKRIHYASLCVGILLFCYYSYLIKYQTDTEAVKYCWNISDISRYSFHMSSSSASQLCIDLLLHHPFILFSNVVTIPFSYIFVRSSQHLKFKTGSRRLM